MSKESLQWILSLILSPKQSLHTTEPASHFSLSALTVLFPCNLFSSLWLGCLLILAIWRSWVPWNHDLMCRISHRPLSIAKIPGPSFDVPLKEKEQNFPMKIHETLYICCFPTALSNDLEDSGAGSTVKTGASTNGRWHARDKEEERK